MKFTKGLFFSSLSQPGGGGGAWSSLSSSLSSTFIMVIVGDNQVEEVVRALFLGLLSFLILFTNALFIFRLKNYHFYFWHKPMNSPYLSEKISSIFGIDRWTSGLFIFRLVGEEMIYPKSFTYNTIDWEHNGPPYLLIFISAST